jgi:hypothetical protein
MLPHMRRRGAKQLLYIRKGGGEGGIEKGRRGRGGGRGELAIPTHMWSRGGWSGSDISTAVSERRGPFGARMTSRRLPPGEVVPRYQGASELVKKMRLPLRVATAEHSA